MDFPGILLRCIQEFLQEFGFSKIHLLPIYPINSCMDFYQHAPGHGFCTGKDWEGMLGCNDCLLPLIKDAIHG